MVIAVGGRTEVQGEPGDQNARAPRNDSTKEPVCFHPMPEEFYDDALHSYFVHRVFDLSCADEALAYTTLKNKLGYVGICYTEEGAKLIMDRLKERLKVDMAVLNHPLYP